MKITYSQPTPTNLPTIRDLCIGSVFRPASSRRIFMLTDMDGESRLLSDDCEALNNCIIEFGCHFDETKDDYETLALCVELDSGEVCLIPEKTFVEEIDYEFTVKEN